MCTQESSPVQYELGSEVKRLQDLLKKFSCPNSTGLTLRWPGWMRTLIDIMSIMKNSYQWMYMVGMLYTWRMNGEPKETHWNRNIRLKWQGEPWIAHHAVIIKNVWEKAPSFCFALFNLFILSFLPQLIPNSTTRHEVFIKLKILLLGILYRSSLGSILNLLLFGCCSSSVNYPP